MIKFTNQNVEIKDTLYGFSYTSGIAQSNFFYNNTSIVFCNEYNAQPRKALLYKNGKLVELAQSKDVKLLYADTNLDRIIFITKDDSASDFANLYMYENGEVNLICSRVNDRKFEFFVINNINDVIMTYLAESKNKSAARIPLWDLFASDLHDTPKLIENDIKDYSAFLTEKNKIKYIIRKWSNIKAKHYAGYFDEDFDWLVIKTDKKSKKFPMGNIGDRFISLQGKLVLLKTVETVHDDDYFLKRKIVYSLSLVNTETFEQVFIEKTHDSQKFRFTNYLYFAGEFIDLDHTTRLGININSDLIEKYPNYFKSGSAKKHEYPYITFFSKTNSKKYYIAMELAKKAKKFEVVDSPYSLDDSQNYIVYYDQASEFGIMEAFLGSMVHLSSSIKFRIFGIDIFDLIRCCSGKFYRSVNDDLEYYRYMQSAILELKKYYKRKSSIQIREILQKEFVDKYGLYIPDAPPDKNLYKTLFKEIEHDLIKQDKLPSKWKSEQDLYRLISTVFNDAIFQYRDPWISPQSIDIYVPTLKCAFEYQGQQHYYSVDYFGGDEAFKKRILLDERKRKLCVENGVTLIEWHYDEPITKLVLNEKLNNIGINIK